LAGNETPPPNNNRSRGAGGVCDFGADSYPCTWDAHLGGGEAGHRNIVLRHLAAGTDADTKDERYGASSLHWAAWCGHLDIVELIIAAKANVNAVNFDGETPLDCATNFSQNEIADLLRKHGGKTGEELKAEGK